MTESFILNKLGGLYLTTETNQDCGFIFEVTYFGELLLGDEKASLSL